MSGIYTMAIVKDGKIIATKSVSSALAGAALAVAPDRGTLTAIEYQFAKKATELARDVLHSEGRLDALHQALKKLCA